jgi:UDP-N-acetyl-D-galactosamine dehydrogenase
VYDPWVDAESAQHEYGITPIDKPKTEHYDAILLAVGHNEFKELGTTGIRRFGKKEHVLFDLKYVLPKEEVDMRL